MLNTCISMYVGSTDIIPCGAIEFYCIKAVALAVHMYMYNYTYSIYMYLACVPAKNSGQQFHSLCQFHLYTVVAQSNLVAWIRATLASVNHLLDWIRATLASVNHLLDWIRATLASVNHLLDWSPHIASNKLRFPLVTIVCDVSCM